MQEGLLMKDLRDPTTSSTTTDKDDESKTNTPSDQNVDDATIENNPKIDAQLISDFIVSLMRHKVLSGVDGVLITVCHIRWTPRLYQPMKAKLKIVWMKLKKSKA